MAIGRISGSVLKSNLTRNGTDLAFETNLLYLDVTNSYVGIGTSSPTALLDINGTVNATAVTATAAVTGGTLSASGTGTDALLTLTTTNISGTASPVIDLKRINPNKPADNDKLGQINFIGEATDSSSVTYGRITTSIFDSAAGSMDGKMQIMLQEGGTLTNAVRIESTGIFLNTGNYIEFEGSVADGNETILTTINPTDDRTISLPDATGTISLITATETLTNKTLTAPTINAGTMTGDFDFADNSKILLGDGDDLKIYHSGSHSIIQDAGIGYLRIRGSKIQIMGNGSDEMQIVSTEDGSAELYYDGSKKVETISTGVQTTGTVNINGAYTFPTSDGSNGQVLQTDGAGALTFADSSGGGGGNNTAIKQFNYYKLTTTSAVIDEFDLEDFRGAVYNISIEETGNVVIGHVKVSVVHNGTTPFISVYDLIEDSTRIVDFSAAISGTKLQLSGVTNSSSHTNLRIYRIALGDHHETVANTNSKIIVSSAISSTASTLDQFTKTDIQGAKYVILIKDSTQTEYQISEVSLTHDGTTVYFNDYAKVSSRSDFAFTFAATISSATLTLTAASTGGITGTAILYRQDLGSKTKLGEFDNTQYGKKSDMDSSVETVDSFDVRKYKTARYFINVGNSGSTEYQNSEITLTVNSAGTTATISESLLYTGNNSLTTFTADVSSGKARLRASSSTNSVIYFARTAIEANNIYRADSETDDNLYIRHDNFNLDTNKSEFKVDTINQYSNVGFISRQYVLHGTTTNNTETEIFIGGVSNTRIPVATNSTMNYTLDITARRTDADGSSAGYQLKGVVDNNSGTVADVGDVYEIIIAEDDADLTIDATADNTNKALKVTVTGQTSHTYKWACVVKTYEVIE